MIRVSAVSYLNTKPFIYGLKKSNLFHNLNLTLDYPSLCAEKLLNNKADISLVPISVLNNQPGLRMISDYCIGADGYVESVCLFSNTPINNIKTIYLDYQSKTSNQLLVILLKEYWKIEPQIISVSEEITKALNREEGKLIIGDRAFKLRGEFHYTYDLAFHWKQMTGLPFVFACWMTNKDLDNGFLQSFNHALSKGLNNMSKVIKIIDKKEHACYNIKDYLMNKISYNLDNKKRSSIDLFLNKISR